MHDYTEWQLAGSPVGGMMTMPAEVPAEAPAYWLATPAPPTATPPSSGPGKAGPRLGLTDIPPGRFAVLVDPWVPPSR